MRYLIRNIVVAFSIAATQICCPEDRSPARSRKDFAAAMSRVTEGMLEAEVLSLLGKPDDVRSEHDAGGVRTARTREIWRYGTSGHLTPATLGKVYIDKQGQAQYIYGKGEPRADESLVEEELRRLLRILAQVPSYNAGVGYNPLKVVQAVNALQPLGKKRALSVIDEHLRVTSYFDDDSREGVFLVLRVLFDVPSPPGYMPEMRVGATEPPAQEDKTLLPRFPISLEDDIPFMLVAGYWGAGEPEPPENHLDYFREHGTIRTRPLSPSATPFATLDVLAKSKRWLSRNQDILTSDERGRQQILEQILRMLDSVYRLEFYRIGPAQSSELLPWCEDEEAKRQQILAKALALKIRWDATKDDYTFLDGTTLPPRKIVHYRRETWKPEISGLKVEGAIERRNPLWVEVSLGARFATEKIQRPFTARAFRTSQPNQTLATFDHRAQLAYDILRVNEGEELQFEFKIDGQTLLSPKFKP
ncbi:MAG TPA: hypothetical protein VGI40_15205 [Pirellulaceae bacterium]|jgi:hypothetical protein